MTNVSAAQCEATANCPGVVEDGYCTECGRAPRKTSAAATLQPAQATQPAETGTRGDGSGGTQTAGMTYSTGAGRSGTRRRIGAGLVSIPPVERRDPAAAIQNDASVPETKRFCASCQAEVGRSRAGRPGRPNGFCRRCGQPYSFTPKLAAGELVAEQYQIAGCLAHGGMGWIYLATDRRVSDRWVVLKGLLDAGDAAAAAAAVAEQRFLAEVEHPNIVKIFNLVEHQDASYIVMEYVGGTSLKEQLKQRRDAAGGRPAPLPLGQAIAYILEILPAFGYLHENNLLFCDFKPDNVIHTAEQLKLIDLGAVVRAGDDTAQIYGTDGYQAPEIATTGPTVETDLYTVGRTLAVLSTEFRGYQNKHAYTLPAPDEIEQFQRFESYYRFLQRATAPQPTERFHSAEEMAEQLLGVLREVLAADADPHPAPSRLFTVEMYPDLSAPNWRSLPYPLPDPDDPAAAYLASVTGTDQEQLLTLLDQAPERTVDIELRAVRALIDAAAGQLRPEYRAAADRLDVVVAEHGHSWRTQWYAGVLALAAGRASQAAEHFDAVYAALPGELAPKLALAIAAEQAGDAARAARYYDTVSTTDPAYTTASAGLARCRLAAGDRRGAVAAYARIPQASSAYTAGQIGAFRALIYDRASMPDLSHASRLLAALELPPVEHARLRADLLELVLTKVRAGDSPPVDVVRDNGTTTPEHEIRLELESAYRILGRAAHGAEKIRLIDAANAVRPRTLL
jgi:serine/threonine-protein kinase PknG